MLRNPYESGRPALSPDLAKNNPELFRSIVLESLRSQTVLGAQVWDTLCRRRQTSPDRLKLNANTWVSNSHATTGEITLGAGAWSQELADKLIFEDWNFKGDRQYVYRTMHEISHLVAPKLHGVFNYQGRRKHTETINFTNALRDMRQDGLGMSPLGSLEFYERQGPGDQAIEDHTELMNMYSIDPAYLKRYLLFLADPKYKNFRAQNNLITLGRETVDNVYGIIRNSMDFFLGDSNER